MVILHKYEILVEISVNLIQFWAVFPGSGANAALIEKNLTANRKIPPAKLRNVLKRIKNAESETALEITE